MARSNLNLCHYIHCLWKRKKKEEKEDEATQQNHQWIVPVWAGKFFHPATINSIIQSYGQHQHLIYEYEYIRQALKPHKYIQRQLITRQ